MMRHHRCFFGAYHKLTLQEYGNICVYVLAISEAVDVNRPKVLNRITPRSYDLQPWVFDDLDFHLAGSCTEKPDIPNINWSAGETYTTGETVTIQCKNDYKLFGSNQVTCLAVDTKEWDVDNNTVCKQGEVNLLLVALS